ncbi:hypothetical protein M9H77_30851 [Catharanthus roseus]|uniref:Uncharacterized protein n=1 Tax=Catharanthus roseus TaxID=4058 RepID=A0ACB9ZYR9_CATRO|nr:hypothetical protein M9H77_30851 [Catharanthus roseus]
MVGLTLPLPIGSGEKFCLLYCVFGVLKCLLPQGFNHQYKKHPKPLNAWLKLQILNRGASNQGGDLGKDWDPILQAQADSYHFGVIGGSLVLFLFLNFLVSKTFISHGRSVPSYATNATILEGTGTTILMPSKGCERLKKKIGSHL